MNTLLLIAALSQSVPVEIHANQTVESRLLLRAIRCDIPCVCEDTRAIRHVQDELRRIVRVRESLDTFIRVGQHNERLPLTAYDSPAYTVLSIKREIDRFNRPKRSYARELPDAEFVRFAGIVNLGDEGNEQVELPWPWQEDFQLTAFVPPTIDR